MTRWTPQTRSSGLRGREPLRHAGDVALEGHDTIDDRYLGMAIDTRREKEFVGDGGLKNLIASVH